MNRIFMASALALGIAAIPAAMILAGSTAGQQPQQLATLPTVPGQSNLTAGNTKLSVCKEIREAGFFYEDFEDAPGSPSFTFPEEWTVTATPGDNDDIWKVGTLVAEGKTIPGASGYKYAFILGNQEHAHDAWAYSPGIDMEAGKEYTIEFYACFYSGSGGNEKLDVTIGRNCNSEEPCENTYTLEDTDRDNYWVKFSEKFTPSETAAYYIGLHSISAAKGEGTLVDDLKITSGPTPAYSGDIYLDFGQTDHLAAPVSCKYDIYNYGNSDLEVKVISSSPEISARTASVVIAPEESGSLVFDLDTNTPGKYSGEIILQTNDPAARDIRLIASAQVQEARLTSYNYEDFEAGGPVGWEFTTGGVNTSDYPALNSSRAFYTSSYYTMLNEDGVGFTTHYVQMGDNPTFSFWYQLTNATTMGVESGPTPADQPKISVQVSDDFGASYDEVYVIEPGGEHEHKPSAEYAQVVVPLLQYAGKTCRVRLLFSHASGDIMDAMTKTFRILVDNVATGTPVQTDLKASLLYGKTLASPGEECTCSVTVDNLGEETVTDYTVKLFDAATGEMITSAKGDAIEPGGNKTTSMSWTPASAGSHKLYATAETTGDAVDSNNTTNSLAIAVLPQNNSAISIGAGKRIKSQGYPVSFYNVESAAQTIYLANELGINKGTINSLVFTSSMNEAFISEPFEVFIGETDKSDFSDNAFVDINELTPVFEGSVYFPEGEKDFVVPFDTPYEYTGKNLVVMTRKLGKEFINSKAFMVRQCDNPRSIHRWGETPGELATPQPQKQATANVYPEVRVNMEKSPYGTVAGKVTHDGKPIAGADIRVKGSNLHTASDAHGSYTLPEVAEGDVSLEISRHGYYDQTTEPFTVTESATLTKDIALTALPTYTVSGKVTSAATGEPVENAKISITGYDAYTATTDADGKYTITGVRGEAGFEYNIIISSPYFENYGDIIAVNGNVTKDASLNDLALRVHQVSASVNENHSEANVSWEEPMPEFRHDTGVYSEPLGFQSGWSEIIFGSVFRQKARIKEISWYTVSGYGAHSNFNVFIFGLNPDGTPNADDIRYVANNVDFVDDDWSVHILPEAVEADGFMIAVSCTGYMAIGTTEPSQTYPFTSGMHYYAGDSYTAGIFDMANFENCHLMLRASGEVLDGTSAWSSSTARERAADRIVRPAAKYNIYRLKDGADRSDWTLVGTSDKPAFTDAGIADLADGRYRYAVSAVYGGGTESMAVMSPVVVVDHSGIENVAAEDNAEAAYYNLQGIRIEHPAKGEVVIVSKGAKTYKTVIR